MPDIRHAHNSPRCSAKSKRSGVGCKNGAMANGKCRIHGGKTPKGQQNAAKHYLYAKFLPQSRQHEMDDIPVGDLDAEIKLLRWQLAEAFRKYLEIEAAPRLDDGLEDPDRAASGMELDEIKDEPVVSGGDEESGPVSIINKRTTKWKRPDYRAHMDRLMGRIIQAEDTRARLMALKGAGAEPVERLEGDDLMAKVRKLLGPKK